MNSPCAAITAAGASSRMGQPKALLQWQGRSLLATMVRSLRAAGFDEIVIILGAHAEAIAREAQRLDVSTLFNERHASGRFSSVRAAALRACPESLLLWPVDCPGVSVSTLRALRREALVQPGANIIPRYETRGGHPVLLSAPTVEALSRGGDDDNLRSYLRGETSSRVDLAVDDPAVCDNLNTPEDYRRFLSLRGAQAQQEAESLRSVQAQEGAESLRSVQAQEEARSLRSVQAQQEAESLRSVQAQEGAERLGSVRVQKGAE